MLTSCAVGQGLALLFGRLFAPSKTNLTGMAQSYYMEANLAGAPPLPSGVHAIIADFGQLFGTATGEELQRWCRNQSWVLFWAPSTGGGDHHHDAGSFSDPSQRMADPSVLAHTKANLTAVRSHHPAVLLNPVRDSLTCLGCPRSRRGSGSSSQRRGAPPRRRPHRRPTARRPRAQPCTRIRGTRAGWPTTA